MNKKSCRFDVPQGSAGSFRWNFRDENGEVSISRLLYRLQAKPGAPCDQRRLLLLFKNSWSPQEIFFGPWKSNRRGRLSEIQSLVWDWQLWYIFGRGSILIQSQEDHTKTGNLAELAENHQKNAPLLAQYGAGNYLAQPFQFIHLFANPKRSDLSNVNSWSINGRDISAQPF